MTKKRYQVFISSTFTDLIEERQAVLKSVLLLDHMPAGMELFPATDAAAWQLICDVIDDSDYYVLVAGGRYGSTDDNGVGYTEKEYDYAIEKSIPVIPLLHGSPENLPRDKTEVEEKAWDRLNAFRSKVEANHTCSYWADSNELQTQVVLGLTSTTKRSPRQGWIRAGKMASDEAIQQIVELQQKVGELQTELSTQSKLPPAGTENLAQGDDEIEVRFKVSYTKSGSTRRNSDYLTRETITRRIAWRTIFGGIGPTFTEYQRESKLRSELTRVFREEFADDIEDKHRDRDVASLSIQTSLCQTVRLQLSALGLMESKQETVPAKYGETKEVEFLRLTLYGKDELIRVRAIYRSS